MSFEDSEYIYLRAQLVYAIEKDVNEAERLFSKWLKTEEELNRYE